MKWLVNRPLAWGLLASVALFAVPVAVGQQPAKARKPAARQPAEPSSEQADPAIPPALTQYKGRQIAPTMHYEGAPWLVRESRQREEDCKTLLEVLDCQPGQVVCDMGCGNGFYSLPIAKAVAPDGRVLAVDIQPEMLRLLDERAKQENIDNIEPVLGTLIDPLLPDGEVDLILLVDVYHEFSHPEQMLAAMRKALKPRGRLALVEFRLEDRNVPIKLLHKMSKKQIMKEIPPNGFKLVEEFDELPWQHLMFFERDDAPQDEAPRDGAAQDGAPQDEADAEPQKQHG